ncbi:hypothetical protein L7F22_052981 [Adiantum nelumboides]|nr:hypothetical protein [Adiantum nelumboides]
MVSFNLYQCIESAFEARKYEDAVYTYLQMVEESVVPTPETLALLIRSLLEAGKLESAQKIYSSLPNLKMKPTSLVFAYLMSAYAKIGNLTMLKILGKEMRDICGRPGDVFKSALNLLQKEGKHDEADSFAKEVWPELTVDDPKVKAQLLGNVRAEDKVQDDLKHLQCTDRKVSIAVAELVRLLEKEGTSVFQQVKIDWTADAVYQLLRQLKSSDLAWEFFKWIQSSSGYVRDLRNEVFVLHILVKSSNFPAFKELLFEVQSKSSLSLEIFNSLIKECAMAKNARAAMWVYSRMQESSLLSDEETFSLLVQAFARSGNPDKASDLCFVMQDVGLNPNVETYTAVIHSLGLAGRSDAAWSVYQRMLAVGLKPNGSTYTALLNVLNVVGNTDLGIKTFKEMNANNVSPTEATQGIMARIWEAAGNFTESQKLETQRKFLSSKRREASLQHIYEVLLEGLVEQDRSPSLLCLS